MAVAMRSQEVRIVASGEALGADVEGVDAGRPFDSSTLALVRRAWLDHLVLRFRGQRLSDEQLMAFSAQFGELDRAPIGTAHDRVGERREGSSPEAYVTVISNVVENGKAIGGLGAYEAEWHTDMSYNERPPTASVLYALEVPPEGGDTGFCNMYRALETLPEATRRRIADLKCVHDASRNSAGELRRGFKDVSDPRETPGAVHPLVRTHPETGRKALFLGRRRNAWIVGLPVDASEALLDELWAHAARPELAWTQRWRVGDAVMWDNRCAMHRRDAFDAAARRVMHRTQLVGDRPF